VAGYIAPRHLQAIKSTGGIVVAALDKSDSVGLLDSYFPDTAFFTEFERFDRHLEKLRLSGDPIDYLVVCSPNYLHDPHIRFGLRYGANVICEKPLVLNPDNAILLQQLELSSKKQVYCILQLRLSPVVAQLRELVAAHKGPERLRIELTYITARGKWYHTSWKGDDEKSGGILTNIGIHLFDLLLWILGDVQDFEMYQRSHDRAAFAFSGG
jgi:UDP-N-acetyl-2-amino-2-deoxyglucuronate dehydrogenase